MTLRHPVVGRGQSRDPSHGHQLSLPLEGEGHRLHLQNASLGVMTMPLLLLLLQREGGEVLRRHLVRVLDGRGRSLHLGEESREGPTHLLEDEEEETWRRPLHLQDAVLPRPSLDEGGTRPLSLDHLLLLLGDVSRGMMTKVRGWSRREEGGSRSKTRPKPRRRKSWKGDWDNLNGRGMMIDLGPPVFRLMHLGRLSWSRLSETLEMSST